ncbi:putative formamidase [Dioscorea sansibarensis]
MRILLIFLFPGLPHPGAIGTAPSHELLNIWNEREKKLVDKGHQSFKLCEVLHHRPLTCIPTAEGCLLGMIKEGSSEWEKIVNEAARMIPRRENGGNCDFKTSVEVQKYASRCSCEIIRGGMKENLTPIGPTRLHVNPIFEPGPVEPRFSEWLVFEGVSVDESGQLHFLDVTVAYERAILNAIHYLSRFGYSEEQVYLLLSCCPCEGRISGIVDAPNAVSTLAIPAAIFDQDVRPRCGRVPSGPRVVKRTPDVLRCGYDGDLPITMNPGGGAQSS